MQEPPPEDGEEVRPLFPPHTAPPPRRTLPLPRNPATSTGNRRTSTACPQLAAQLALPARVQGGGRSLVEQFDGATAGGGQN